MCTAHHTACMHRAEPTAAPGALALAHGSTMGSGAGPHGRSGVAVKSRSSLSARSCVFTKFNTDEVGGMRSLLEISAMPTFKVFKAKAEVGCQRGWNESRAVLTQYDVAAAWGCAV